MKRQEASMPETHNDVTRVWIYVEIRIYSQAPACESYKVWPQTYFSSKYIMHCATHKEIYIVFIWFKNQQSRPAMTFSNDKIELVAIPIFLHTQF